jgi:hypothetical protein
MDEHGHEETVETYETMVEAEEAIAALERAQRDYPA